MKPFLLALFTFLVSTLAHSEDGKSDAFEAIDILHQNGNSIIHISKKGIVSYNPKTYRKMPDGRVRIQIKIYETSDWIAYSYTKKTNRLESDAEINCDDQTFTQRSTEKYSDWKTNQVSIRSDEEKKTTFSWNDGSVGARFCVILEKDKNNLFTNEPFLLLDNALGSLSDKNLLKHNFLAKFFAHDLGLSLSQKNKKLVLDARRKK
jgi:hypothetical protein